MVDRSIVGWETVAEYETDPIANDSDDGKKIREVKNSTLSKRKSKKSNKSAARTSSQRSLDQELRIDVEHNGFTPPNQRNFNLRFQSNYFV